MALALSEEVAEQLNAAQAALSKLEGDARRLADMLRGPNTQPMKPLERAVALQALMQAVHAAWLMHVRTAGIDASKQDATQKEEQRLGVYAKKVSKAVAAEQLKVLRPTLALDVGAANRFIEHAIPELSQEQRDALRSAAAATKRKAEELDAERGGQPRGKMKQASNKQAKWPGQGPSSGKAGKPVASSAKDAALQFLAGLEQERVTQAVGVSTTAEGAEGGNSSDGEQ